MTFKHEFITIADKTYIDVKSKNYLSSNFTGFHKKTKINTFTNSLPYLNIHLALFHKFYHQ